MAITVFEQLTFLNCTFTIPTQKHLKMGKRSKCISSSRLTKQKKHGMEYFTLSLKIKIIIQTKINFEV
jgi:hypothetical protein